MNDDKVLYVCSRCFEETGGSQAGHTIRMLHRTPIRILRIRQVSAMTGLGHSMIYQLQAEKRFPRSIRITGRIVGWIEEEIQRWLAMRIDDNRPAEDHRSD